MRLTFCLLRDFLTREWNESEFIMNAIRVLVALIGCFIYGLSITYVGGIENALSQQFGMSASVMGSLNNLYLFGAVLGLLLCSSLLDGQYAHRVIVLLSFLLTLSFFLVGMPHNETFLMLGELLMGCCAISYMVYAIKLSNVYYPLLMHRLLPLVIGFVILGNSGTSFVEEMTLYLGFIESNGIITVLLLCYSFILALTVKPFSAATDSDPKEGNQWVKQIFLVLEPLKSRSVTIITLSAAISVGFVTVVFFNIVTPMIYVNTAYQGMTSMIYLLKAVFGLLIGLMFTEQLSTNRSLTVQYGLICLCAWVIAFLFYHHADLFYVTASLALLAVLVSTNSACSLRNITRNIAPSHSARIAGCFNLLYKTVVFIIGLPMGFILPHQTIDRIDHRDLLGVAVYFVILSSVVFMIMSFLFFTKKGQQNK